MSSSFLLKQVYTIPTDHKMVHTYHIYIYINFLIQIKNYSLYLQILNMYLTHTEMLSQKIKCSIKKARYHIVFAIFAKEVRSVHKITTHFTLSSKSICQLGYARY
jgi:hypothetical protein